MTDETKKLFDAPWVLFSDPDNEVFQIESNSGDFIAEAMMFKDAKRLARLPELYDALMEQLKSFCWAHCKEDGEKNLHDGCSHVGGCVTCLCTKHFDLLRKVRDGK